MKKTILALSLMACTTAYAGKIGADKVPAAVKATFGKNFPKAANVKWEDEHGNYEANFADNGKKMSATFDAKGGLLETEHAIAVSALPAQVADYVAKNYKGTTIKEAAELKMADGSTRYEAEVNKTDLVFDASGKFIKAVKD